MTRLSRDRIAGPGFLGPGARVGIVLAVSIVLVLSLLFLWRACGRVSAGVGYLVEDGAAPGVAEGRVLASRAVSVLGSRCIACHGPLRQKGELRLDRREDLLRGLASGEQLLHVDPARSELFRRVTSPDEDARMPKDRAVLSAEEIEVLRHWLEAGAPWDASWEEAERAVRRLELLDRWDHFLRPVRPFAVPLVVVLCFWLALGRLSRLPRREGSGGLPLWRRMVDHAHRRPVSLILLAVAIGFGRKAAIAEEAREEMVRKMLGVEKEQWSRRNANFIRRPPHPPRLGGIYYRGNDERSPKLYNGGFYCTCTFDVFLRQGGRKLVVGDSVSTGEPLEIAVEIDRAPFATAHFFNDKRMTAVVLTDRNVQAEPSTGERAQVGDGGGALFAVPFRTVESGERWLAAFPLPKPPPSPEEGLEGELFVAPSEGKAPHYGLGYRIRVRDGRVSGDSEIWMGSIYHTGNVVIPAEKDIPLVHWFDFREIPMIEGGNTEDGELLGIEE